LNSGAGFVQVPRNAVYGPPKHALRALAHSLRAGVEDDGVRATSIFAGPADTPLFPGGVARPGLIRPPPVARGVIGAITGSEHTRRTAVRVRPPGEPPW